MIIGLSEEHMTEISDDLPKKSVTKKSVKKSDDHGEMQKDKKLNDINNLNELNQFELPLQLYKVSLKNKKENAEFVESELGSERIKPSLSRPSSNRRERVSVYRQKRFDLTDAEEGYYYRRASGEEKRLRALVKAGYEFVEGELNDFWHGVASPYQDGTIATYDTGNKYTGYIMRIPLKKWKEDQKEKLEDTYSNEKLSTPIINACSESKEDASGFSGGRYYYRQNGEIHFVSKDISKDK